MCPLSFLEAGDPALDTIPWEFIQPGTYLKETASTHYQYLTRAPFIYFRHLRHHNKTPSVLWKNICIRVNILSWRRRRLLPLCGVLT